ncbi:ABC transporter substrate-binding protein [Fusobacterium sp.]|uniref:ABC transporter substrate-binding protein n=1 Tax=Fusobacterium sp. TaxID=68766 RepID=UPI00261038B4|nr:ABC transporter substrate-binding protein [Fusobacterium sp.]
MKNLKIMAKVGVVTLLGMLLLSCGKEEKVEKKEIKTTMSMDIDSLNPYKMVSSGTEEIMLNVFEGLLMPNTKGELIPAIAEEYSVSEDGLYYTFKIREGIKFHNGNPLDVKDVEFSLKRMSGKDGFPPSSALFQEIEDIKVLDGNRVQIKLKEADSAFIYSLTEGIVPDENADQLDKNPIGTGPFRIAQYDREQQLVLDRFDDYWGEKAKVDRVTIFVVPNNETAFLKLLSGEINMLSRVDSKRVNELKNFNNVSAPQNTVQIFALNNDVKPFDDERVRKAINLAINKDEIIAGVMGGDGIKLETNMSPVMSKFCIDNIGEKQNIEEAKKLLTESGNSNLTFTIKVPSNYQMHVDTAQIIAEQLKNIGVTAKIETIEWTTWLSDVYSGRKYEGTIVGLSGKLDPYSILRRYTSDYKSNFFNFKDAEYDELIQNAKESTVDEIIVTNYKKAQEILRDKQAAIYIMDPKLITTLDKKISGFEYYPLSYINFSKMNIEE